MENQISPPPTSVDASSSAADHLNADNSCSNILYDGYVFINHRGEIKKTFAGHLYHGLLHRGLRPFLDQHELQEGLNFPSQLKAAIRSASVHIAIFSPKYAESQWCLDELLLMQESGAPIIPIFYHVKPAEVRWTKNGVYAQALNKLQKKSRYDTATIQKWRDALSSVANISGFDLDAKFNGDEALMLERILERVVEMSPKPGLYVAKYPTGLNDKVTDFETTVLKQQRSGKVQVVGIVGLGGAGKTTLSLELFNRKRSNYDKSYFLSDVREKANKSSLHSLQRELLKGLTNLHLQINKIHEGIGMFERHLKSFHVFLILDDIDNEDQLEAFLPLKDVLSPNSLILITSRNINVLQRSRVEQLSIYKLTGLSTQHSRELFCSYAFYQPYPPQEFEDLVAKFLHVCDGLPLSLKVVGALLCGKNNKSTWEVRLHQVKVPCDIQKRLKISYDALGEEEQQIFLDIACFFIGQKKSSAITFWNGSGLEGLLGFENLEGKCLVEVDSENVIHMHDHLRDMGRDIAKEKLPRRLWRPIESIDDWLHQQSSVITEARGINISHRDTSNKSIINSSMLSLYQTKIKKLFRNRLFRNRFPGVGATKLQFLSTEGYLLERILRRVHPQNLIWLSWTDCPYSYLPSWIPMRNLRVLKVQGKVLETLWQGKSQAPNSFGNLKNLYHMDLSGCEKLKRLPDSLGSLTNLHHLDLSVCKKLERLPDSLGSLTNLHHLDLSVCEKLERLPDSLGSLTNLHHLDLSGCEKLERLPDSLGSLTNLHHLDLSVCEKLERLPDSLGSLTNLHHLDLSRCEKLERLPDSLGSLTNLHHLDLSRCEKLERLPDSLGSLTNLHHLDLSRCEKLERLPDSLGSLTNLHHLDLSPCEKLERLPDSLGSLRNLHHLDLSRCYKLERLPDSLGSLTNLHHLDLSRCYKLERLPDSLGSLTNLHHLDLSRCYKLETLPDSLGSLTNLHHLDLSRCEKLERLPDSLGSLTNLHHLDLSRCEKLERLPDSLGSLTNLDHLDLSVCKKLERLPDSLGSLTNLHHLDLSWCKKLERLPDSLGSLTNLHHLDLSGCQKLERLPVSFGNFSNLKYLDLSSCSYLIISSDILGNIRTLEHISVSHCEKNEIWLSKLAHQRSLKILKLRGTNLKELPSAIGVLSNLEVLWIESLWQDTLPPSLGDLRNLKELRLRDCRELQCLPASVGRLIQLTKLEVVCCPAFKLLFEGQREIAGTLKSDYSIQKYMPSLQWLVLEHTEVSEVSFDEGVCPNLQHLILKACSNLVKVGTLPNTLTEVELSSCHKMKNIEALGGLAKLQILKIEQCNELQELPSVKTLVSLWRLRAIDCVKLKSIGDLGHLTKLQFLEVSGCLELEELEGLENCKSLRYLDASRCPKLQWGEE